MECGFIQRLDYPFFCITQFILNYELLWSVIIQGLSKVSITAIYKFIKYINWIQLDNLKKLIIQIKNIN